MPKHFSLTVPNASLGTNLNRIFRLRLRQMLSYKPGTLKGKDVEAIHQMRVSARRLQAMLKIFHEHFPAPEFKSHYAVIRQVIRILGRGRELDIILLIVRDYEHSLGGAVNVSMLSNFRRELERERMHEQAIITKGLAAHRLAAF